MSIQFVSLACITFADQLLNPGLKPGMPHVGVDGVFETFHSYVVQCLVIPQDDVIQHGAGYANFCRSIIDAGFANQGDVGCDIESLEFLRVGRK